MADSVFVGSTRMDVGTDTWSSVKVGSPVDYLRWIASGQVGPCLGIALRGSSEGSSLPGKEPIALLLLLSLSLLFAPRHRYIKKPDKTALIGKPVGIRNKIGIE